MGTLEYRMVSTQTNSLLCLKGRGINVHSRLLQPVNRVTTIHNVDVGQIVYAFAKVFQGVPYILCDLYLGFFRLTYDSWL